MCSIHFQEQLAFIIISSVRSVGIRACQNSPPESDGGRGKLFSLFLPFSLPSLLWENTVKTRETDADGGEGNLTTPKSCSVVPSVRPSIVHPSSSSRPVFTSLAGAALHDFENDIFPLSIRRGSFSLPSCLIYSEWKCGESLSCFTTNITLLKTAMRMKSAVLRSLPRVLICLNRACIARPLVRLFHLCSVPPSEIVRAELAAAIF